MRYSVPLLGPQPKSRQLLTKHQGYCRARGGEVELNCPGLYSGPPLPWDKAYKIAKKGITDSNDAMNRRELVKIIIPGHFNGAAPAEQAKHLFQKILRAALQAKEQAETINTILRRVVK